MRDYDDVLAVCIQHEIDHLEGKLFVDYLSDLKRERIRKKLEKERKERAVWCVRAPAARGARTDPSLRPGFRAARPVSGLRIAFAGTPDFSVPPLEALLGAGYDVVGVLTQPDRPKGRDVRSPPARSKLLLWPVESPCRSR